MIHNFEDSYIALLNDIMEGSGRNTRNGETRTLFGVQLKSPELKRTCLPLLLGRKVFYRGVVGEMAAFLKGPKNLGAFLKEGCNFWRPWAGVDGTLTVDYGNAWLDFNGVNQLEKVVNSLKDDPMSRRHLISGWRPDTIDELSLPCCHYAYQWFIDGEYLDMLWIQRSADSMIGLPSDIFSAALFNILMAQTVGKKPGQLTFQLGDTHIYKEHYDAVDQYIWQYTQMLPRAQATWYLHPEATVFNFEPHMFDVLFYHPEAAIKLEVKA